MRVFKFSRQVTVREPINRFGQMGFTLHEEVVYIPAENEEEAEKKIKLFNYKKHFKFELKGEVSDKIKKDRLEIVLDMGVIA